MFIPHTESEKIEMLQFIGANSIEELFNDVPAAFRFPTLNLPPSLTEMEAIAQVQEYAAANETTRELVCFLGAGAYRHYIPAAVDQLISRNEFYTAYTPYQPEVSQGTLQAIFEYQSLIANLTGMESCNASHYDGATATAEAGVMAYHHYRGSRKKIVLHSGVNPQYRQVLCTYLCGFEGIEIVNSEDSDPLAGSSTLESIIDTNTALVVVQYPDFFGRIFNFKKLSDIVHENGSLLCIAINPISLGLLIPPGEMGADIVVGEGQPLGIPLSFGGPYLGLFATRKELIRKVAGRLVGETVDQMGRKGYVLTLTAREQHIRREKSTSNICSNQGLMALASTIYLSLVGKHGLKQVATLCYQKAHYAAERLNSISGYSVVGIDPFFNEFVVKCPSPIEDINNHLLEHGILGGYALNRDYPKLENHMLVAVTEMNTKDEIDYLCEVLEEVTNA